MEQIIIIFFLIIFSLIQSVIGVGVLMFGTPTFLLLGYNYVETLNIVLLPSIFISLLQIIIYKNAHEENIKVFKKEFLFVCLPFLLLGLILMKKYYSEINFQLFVGILISLFFIIRIFPISFEFFNLKKNSKIIHAIVGIVHGITNMGGVFLSMFSLILFKENKHKIRYAIAFAYLIMGIIQLIYIIYLFPISLEYKHLIYVVASTITFFLIGNKLFNTINNFNYNNLVNIVILFYAVLLITISI